MQCRIVCLSRWPIFFRFFEFQQNPCYFYLDACLFQSALFLIDYLAVLTNSSLIGIDVLTTEVYLVLFGSCLFLLC